MTHVEIEALWEQTERECLGLKDWAKRSHFAALVTKAETAALQKSFEQECGDVDTLLVLLQLDPKDYRSDAGWLLLHKIHAVIAARNAERDALREQLAKSCSEDQRHAFGGCPIANGLAARVAILEEAAKAAEAHADQLQDDLDHFMRGDNQ